MNKEAALVIHEAEELTPEIALTEDQTAVLAVILPIFEAQALKLEKANEDIAILKEALEVNVVMTTAQGKAIRAAVNLRVRSLCEGENEYKERSKKLFACIWRALKEAFAVDTYREIPRSKYGSAVAFISRWQPSE